MSPKLAARTRSVTVPRIKTITKLCQESHREVLGAGLFTGVDGPLQVSSRAGSVRSSHGVTYFQPEELTGTVQLGDQLRKRLTGGDRFYPHTNGTSKWQHNPAPQAYLPNGHDHSQQHTGDSDSDFISVSAQATPRTQRKEWAHAQATTNGNAPVSVSSPFRNTEARNGWAGSCSDVDGQRVTAPPHSSHHCHDDHNHHNSTANRRRHSRESIVDAYGLVIHGRDRGHDLTFDQGQGEGRGGVLVSATSPQEAYANFKLQYFSTPDVLTSKADNGVASATNGHVQQNTDSENGVLDSSRELSSTATNGGWSSAHPFGRRALYRAQDSSTEYHHASDTTLPLRGFPDSAHSEKVVTPDPDYTPLPTPRGSTRSLNTEVARVLRDFENTLRAHEPPQRASLVETGPVAFV